MPGAAVHVQEPHASVQVCACAFITIQGETNHRGYIYTCESQGLQKVAHAVDTYSVAHHNASEADVLVIEANLTQSDCIGQFNTIKEYS